MVSQFDCLSLFSRFGLKMMIVLKQFFKFNKTPNVVGLQIWKFEKMVLLSEFRSQNGLLQNEINQKRSLV